VHPLSTDDYRLKVNIIAALDEVSAAILGDAVAENNEVTGGARLFPTSGEPFCFMASLQSRT
jgi:hypothetical protein